MSLQIFFCLFDVTRGTFLNVSHNLQMGYRFVSPSILEITNASRIAGNPKTKTELFLFFKSILQLIRYFDPSPGPSGCVWSNCSCTKTCTDLAEPEIERCNEETCKPGWACQPGLVLLNNKVVSPVLECPCYHDETFYKVRLARPCPRRLNEPKFVSNVKV